MKKILIVDDDPRLRGLVSATLGNDYALFEAEDGLQALDAVGKENPDLILLDVSMPKMDGFEVCRRLKSESTTNHVKIMMLTGMDSTEDRKRGEEVGADEYFTKPFSPRALLDKISEILGED